MNTDKTKVVMDGFGSFLTGYKMRKSNKSIAEEYEDQNAPLTASQIYDMMHHDGFGARVVNCVAEDMVREGFRIIGDTSNIVMAELNRLNFLGVLKTAVTYARAYGGGAILMGINDGRPFDQYVAINAIKGINFIKALPAYAVKGDDKKRILDKDTPQYGEFSNYLVKDGISPEEYSVHRDRMLLIVNDYMSVAPSGMPSMNMGDIDHRVWGHSVLEPIQQQVSDISLFGMSLSHLAQEAVIGKYKIANLAEMLATDEHENIYNRLDIINDSKSVINGVLLDADSNEDYVRDTLSFSGINGVADTQMVFLSGVSGIPVTRLFGRSPAGLDASGESDLVIYYDMVHAEQLAMLTAVTQRFVFYVNQYKRAILIEPADEVLRRAMTPEAETDPISKEQPLTEADVHIEWNPLRQMSQKERADTYMTNAQADTQYVHIGVLSREEVRKSRFLNGYNQEISVDSSVLPEIEEEVDPPEEETTPAEGDDKKGKEEDK